MSATARRRMLPVAMYGRLKSSVSRSAWVPLPAPGGPSRMRFSSDIGGEPSLLRAATAPQRGEHHFKKPS